MDGSIVEQGSVDFLLEPDGVNLPPKLTTDIDTGTPELPELQSTDAAFITDDPLSYWKGQLTGCPAPRLPTDNPRSLTATCNLQSYASQLSSECREGLKQLSLQSGVPVSTVIIVAFNAFLYRYTGQAGIVIGLPSTAYVFCENEEAVDACHNTRVLRTEVNAKEGFTQLLDRVNEKLLSIGQIKEVPYKMLENAVNQGSNSAVNGLYTVTFSFKSTIFDDQNVGSKVLTNVPEKADDAVEIDLQVEETLSALNFNWNYNPAIFHPDTINRFSKHFGVLLNSIIVNPGQEVCSLQFISAEEQWRLSQQQNVSVVDYPADKCIHHLFEEQVMKTPNAKALVFEGATLTYLELNERANQLAFFLRYKGVRNGTLVPVCINPSLEMIIGVLGILKAGGAYVPLDPNSPPERLAFVLKDTGAPLVVCNKESSLKLIPFQHLDLVSIDDENDAINKQHTHNLDTCLSANDLAYLIYTSGTTGMPKGVMIEHRSLTDHCYGLIDSAALKQCRSFALFSPLVFDAGHAIIHSALLTGGVLHILSKELILDSRRVETYLNEKEIDCIKIVPSLWLSYAGLQHFALAKKVMIFGGEAFAAGIITNLKKVNYGGTVYNHYGPTEVTIGKCIYRVHLDTDYQAVPIGKPFSNTRLYILDQYLQLVPEGVEGELYIGGDGLARGYLNLPRLTAEMFISDPFMPDMQVRIYKTGDKAKWLPDGNIAYTGRTDEQVKIYGHRIEPGEIENVLLQSGMVCHAVVLALSDERGHKRLVQYLVPEKHFDKNALNIFLKSKLPDYMIPAGSVLLEHLPLTKNGKINKKKLEVLEKLNRNFVCPASATELRLAEIWQNLLHIGKVSVHDNFFELGGNSLLAGVLFARVKQEFHKSFPLSAIFTYPTIGQLAAAIELAEQPHRPPSNLIPLQTKGTKAPLFCIHAGQGDVLFYANLSLSLGNDQPVYALQAKGINRSELPPIQMERMVKEYIHEIKKIQPQGPYYLAGYCLGARIVYEMAQQLTGMGQQVALLANFNGVSPTYGRLSTGTKPKPQGKIKRIVSKLGDHIRHIDGLSLKEKTGYVYDRLKIQLLSKLRKPFFIMRFQLHGTLFRLFLAAGQKVPNGLARNYVAQSLFILQYRYWPKPYNGDMVVFHSPSIYNDPYLGWESFVKGEVITIAIPGNHETRRDILNEPYVHSLAHQLKTFLQVDNQEKSRLSNVYAPQPC